MDATVMPATLARAPGGGVAGGGGVVVLGSSFATGLRGDAATCTSAASSTRTRTAVTDDAHAFDNNSG